MNAVCGFAWLFDRAKKGDVSILVHPLAATIADDEGQTPLHWLAEAGKCEIASHPQAIEIRNNWGETPLEILGEVGEPKKERGIK